MPPPLSKSNSSCSESRRPKRFGLDVTPGTPVRPWSASLPVAAMMVTKAPANMSPMPSSWACLSGLLSCTMQNRSAQRWRSLRSFRELNGVGNGFWHMNGRLQGATLLEEFGDCHLSARQGIRRSSDVAQRGVLHFWCATNDAQILDVYQPSRTAGRRVGVVFDELADVSMWRLHASSQPRMRPRSIHC